MLFLRVFEMIKKMLLTADFLSFSISLYLEISSLSLGDDDDKK